MKPSLDMSQFLALLSTLNEFLSLSVHCTHSLHHFMWLYAHLPFKKKFPQSISYSISLCAHTHTQLLPSEVCGTTIWFKCIPRSQITAKVSLSKGQDKDNYIKLFCMKRKEFVYLLTPTGVLLNTVGTHPGPHDHPVRSPPIMEG